MKTHLKAAAITLGVFAAFGGLFALLGLYLTFLLNLEEKYGQIAFRLGILVPVCIIFISIIYMVVLEDLQPRTKLKPRKRK